VSARRAREGALAFRGLRVFYTGLATALTLEAHSAHAAGDPALEWRTRESTHFRVHYYSGEEAIAERVTRIAEQVHTELVPALASDPGHPVDIVLTDDSDSANGSATAFPYDVVRLYAVAPDELSPLGDVDDWYRALFTHEYTHILHLTHIEGLPALWNRVVGRTLVPNQWAPRFTLEGLAVLEETRHTSGGRLRSSLWDGLFRADRRGADPATLDRVSGNPRTWPQGNLWYLYGSYFYQWVDRTFGHEALRTLIASYGGEPIPYGVERSFRRATGRTLSELWSQFLADEDARAAELHDAHVAGGPREGQALTTHGYTAAHARWLPATEREPERIVYFRSDGHDTAGIVAIPMHDGTASGHPELVTRTAGEAHVAGLGDGSLLFDAPEISNQVYAFGDISRLPPSIRDRWGDDTRRIRLTHGVRADGLDVSPDGHRVVFITRHRGQAALVEAPLEGDKLGPLEILVRGEGFDQLYAPRYAPDGQSIVYGAWLGTGAREALIGRREGGARDLFRFDRKTRETRALTRDHAIDGGACFSPDGRWLYFHSDRIDDRFEVHAIDLQSGDRYRVTRSEFAALEPAVSPRGDFLAFSSYAGDGWNVRVMALDPATFERVDVHPEAPRETPHPEPLVVESVDRDYVPLESLRPRAYGLQVGTGTFGTAVVASTSGADASGNHAFTLTGRVETDRPELQVDALYNYSRLRADLGIRSYRSLSARGGGTNRALYVLPWVQESVGLETSASVPLPSTFASQSLELAMGFVRIAGEPAPGATNFDPFNRPLIPFRGELATVRASWAYRRTQSFLHSVGAERGHAIGVSGLVASDLVGSSKSGISLSANASTYLPVAALSDTLEHHVLALHLGSGVSDGDYPGPGAYSLGGYTATTLASTLQNVVVQGGVALRGYEPFSISGRSFFLGNAEYRFPIVNIDRGIGAYPVFARRVSGTLFSDAGTAFNVLSQVSLRTSSGAELWVDTTSGYFVDLLFRIGLARGWNDGGVWQLYGVATTVY